MLLLCCRHLVSCQGFCPLSHFLSAYVIDPGHCLSGCIQTCDHNSQTSFAHKLIIFHLIFVAAAQWLRFYKLPAMHFIKAGQKAFAKPSLQMTYIRALRHLCPARSLSTWVLWLLLFSPVLWVGHLASIFSVSLWPQIPILLFLSKYGHCMLTSVSMEALASTLQQRSPSALGLWDLLL